MFSEAGRSYEKTRIVSPYKTRQRWLYYQHEPIKPQIKEPKQYQTLNTNLRQKKDSYLLRYAKDITLNTDHHPSFQTVQIASPRQVFGKGPCQRYIGDIRDEDFSKQLPLNCDHRCSQANQKKLNETRTTSSIKSHHSMDLSFNYMSNASKQQSEQKQLGHSQHKRLKLSQLKSTETTLIKKRSKLTIQVQKNIPAQKRLKGVSFDSSVGHRYLQEVEKRDHLPELYQIQKSKESLVRKSFKEPSIDVQFGKFRNSISTRYDRADPYWQSIDKSDCEMKEKDMSYNFNHYSSRKMNEVKSKYPHRVAMNLYMFPVKELKV